MFYKQLITSVCMFFTIAHASNNVPGYAPVEIDPERLQLYGVTSEIVEMRDLTKTIRTVGIVTVDERRISNIQTKFNGWIEKLYVNFTNEYVKKGDPLFKVYSPELFSTQEEYLLALKGTQRKIEGRFSEELHKSDLELFMAAKKRLELWDIPTDEIKRLENTMQASKTLLLRSPVSGVVTHLNAFLGKNVMSGMNIYVIADLSKIWILGDIYEQDIDLVNLGQKAILTITSFPAQYVKKEITFIDYILDESARTVKVRFESDNFDFRLKPGMYGTVEIQKNMGKSLAIPEEAVINTGERKIVFVDKGHGYFEPRDIEIGFKAEQYYQVISGVSQGERVITSSQFLIDSESRLKGSGDEKVKDSIMERGNGRKNH